MTAPTSPSGDPARRDAPGTRLAALYASRGLPVPQPSPADVSWARAAVDALADGAGRRNAA